MIESKDYSFTYGTDEGQASKHGVHHIDLTIPAGKCVLLCGPSGCGKSTLLKSINGLIPNFFQGQMEGAVLIDDVTVTELPEYELAKQTASVFQNPKSQFFNTDVESEIAYGLENQGMDVAVIDERLAETIKTLNLDPGAIQEIRLILDTRENDVEKEADTNSPWGDNLRASFVENCQDFCTIRLRRGRNI